METWPNILPAPRVDLDTSISSSTITNRMESGLTRQRHRFTAIRRGYKASWIMSNIQFMMFETFVKTKLSMGADKFKMLLPLSGLNTIEESEVIILGGAYDARCIAANNKWEISCTLIVDDRRDVDNEIYELLLNFEGGDQVNSFSGWLNKLYITTNTLILNP